MYCPKCASTATEGQRFCRQCGTNLGVIVDAMDGKRGPVDFERLKVDLKDLGTSLRAGFEQAHQEFKKTQHKNRHQWGRQASNWGEDAGNIAAQAAAQATSAIKTAKDAVQPWWMHQKSWKNPESRRYHLQQGILKILTGAAGTTVWYYLLNIANNSGLLQSLERVITQHAPNVTGIVPFIQMLWVLGLIPVAQGVGHLVAAAFASPAQPIAESPQPQIAPPPIHQTVAPEMRNTNEIKPDYANIYSVTEEPTVPLKQPERERQAM